MTMTLASVLSKPAGPYDLPLKVKVIMVDKVVDYKNGNGETKQSLDFVVGDSTRIGRVRNYDSSKNSIIKAGNSLIIRKYITKGSGNAKLVITANSKLYKTTEVGTVENAELLAKQELHPPPAPEVTLKDVQRSPIKSLVSIKGQVVQEEMAQTVMAFNKPSTVKGFIIQNDDTKCRVSLWRDLAAKDIKTGDYVSITNVIVGQWNREVSLSSTTSTKIEKIQMPEEKIYARVSGIYHDKTKMVLLLDTDKEFTVSNFEGDPDSLLDQEVEMTVRGETVLAVKLKGTQPKDEDPPSGNTSNSESSV
ncbi:hypothetical protein KUTeg_011579 [Tegillarca granosa]|uniref:Uncharacterized protein n=1 Tax=Tegillarca granosa TaxID=220873 RepID=A0ABQ9EX07_TEGGR|nr:hypothetical protein KUTeg_011579 [Tegillarca granosa]